MLRFFRHIRKTLIEHLPAEQTGSKVRTYILYALGEIALVMIGILLALQVNNWNQERENERIITTVIEGVKEDLMDDILEAEFLINWYEIRDSLITNIVGNTYTRKDYERGDSLGLYVAGMYWFPFVINKESFESLNVHIDKIPPEQQGIIKNLNTLYTQTWSLIETSQSYMDDHLNGYRTYLVDEQGWYGDYVQDIYSDEVIDYFSQSELHKRKLLRYKDISEGIQNMLNQIIDQSIYNYLLLHDTYTPKKPIPEYFNQLELYVPEGDGNVIAGRYEGPDGKLIAEVKTRQTMSTLNYESSDQLNNQPYILSEFSEDTLIIKRNGHRVMFQSDKSSSSMYLKILQENGNKIILKKNS